MISQGEIAEFNGVLVPEQNYRLYQDAMGKSALFEKELGQISKAQSQSEAFGVDKGYWFLGGILIGLFGGLAITN